MLRYFPITGRFLFTDDPAGGQAILDTDDGMLCVKPEDVEISSVNVPARTSTSSGVDGTQVQVDIQEDYYIATLDIPRASVVRGMMRVTWDTNPEPADNLWRQASGTHLDILDGVSQTTVPQDDLAGYNRVATLGGYSFLINDLGHLVLRERIVIRCRDSGGPPDNFSRARRAATVSFRLLCGFFLQQDFTVAAGLDYRAGFGTSGAFADYTFENVNLGYAFTGRRIVIAVISLNSGTAVTPTITVGVVSATIHEHSVRTGTYGIAVTIASVAYPTGTTATIVVSYAGDTPDLCYGFAYALKTVTSNTPVTSESAVTGSSTSIDMTVGAGSFGIVVAAGGTNTAGTPTMTNVDDLRASQAGTLKYAIGVIKPGAGTETVTATFPASVDLAMLGAVFS